jgi:hypothetical protein
MTEEAVHELATMTYSGVSTGIIDIGKVVFLIPDTLKKCGSTYVGLKHLYQAAVSFQNPSDFTYQVGYDLLINSVSIFHDVRGMIEDYRVKDFYSFGEKLGTILEKVLIGNHGDDALKPTDDKSEETSSTASTSEEEPEIVDFLALNLRSTKTDAV